MYDRKTAKKRPVWSLILFHIFYQRILPGEVESSGGLSRPILEQTSMDRMWQGTFFQPNLLIGTVQMAQDKAQKVRV